MAPDLWQSGAARPMTQPSRSARPRPLRPTRAGLLALAGLALALPALAQQAGQLAEGLSLIHI